MTETVAEWTSPPQSGGSYQGPTLKLRHRGRSCKVPRTSLMETRLLSIKETSGETDVRMQSDYVRYMTKGHRCITLSCVWYNCESVSSRCPCERERAPKTSKNANFPYVNLHVKAGLGASVCLDRSHTTKQIDFKKTRRVGESVVNAGYCHIWKERQVFWREIRYLKGWSPSYAYSVASVCVCV